MHLYSTLSFLSILATTALASPHSPHSTNLQDQHQAPMSPPTTKPAVYFGYGSNLWLEQMSIRCPTAKYLGVARLNNYAWMINDRGYANIVSMNTTSAPPNNTHVVYGLVYSLEKEDERRLDLNEGVPVAYTKEYLECDFWSAGEASAPLDKHKKVNTSETPSNKRDMLVYIDRNRTAPDEPRKEYVYRMNQGISDAVKLGVPQEYVDDVMRKYIPKKKADGDDEVGEFARGQAAQFRDESVGV